MSGSSANDRAGVPGPEALAIVRQALGEALQAASDERTRAHWVRYLRGEAQFRGVAMGGIRRIVNDAWRGGLAALGVDGALVVALDWLDQSATEDKLAGILLIAEHLARDLRDDDVVALATAFERGAIADWNACDWMCVKALHAFVTGGTGVADPGRCHAVAAWQAAPSMWQRRAAVVTFVTLAPRGEANFPGFSRMVLDASAASLEFPDRFAQTGPGWVLRELSRAEPNLVRDFVKAHPELSSEARRMAMARLLAGRHRRR